MILSEITKGAKKIGVSGHIRPDGDCFGSTIALTLYLKKICKDAQVTLYLEQLTDNMSDITSLTPIDTTYESDGEFDVFFAVDCGKDRLGKAEALFDKAKMTANIDHHVTNVPGTGVVNYVKPEVGSASELIYELILADEGSIPKEERIDKEIALALYIGIIHDTGVLQYSNTRPETHIIVSELIKFGFDFPRIIEETFYQKTYLQNQLMGRALLESVRFLDNRCVVSCIDKKTQEFYEATPHDMDGIVNQLRNMEGIACAVFMYELEHGVFKISLRTTPEVDAVKVASVFGGGGHARAAGLTMAGTFHDCINNISREIEKQLEEKA